MIIPASDLEASIEFYAGVLCLPQEGQDDRFTVLRVIPELPIPCFAGHGGWGASRHLDVRPEFWEVFQRIRTSGLALR